MAKEPLADRYRASNLTCGSLVVVNLNWNMIKTLLSFFLARKLALCLESTGHKFHTQDPALPSSLNGYNANALVHPGSQNWTLIP